MKKILKIPNLINYVIVNYKLYLNFQLIDIINIEV